MTTKLPTDVRERRCVQRLVMLDDDGNRVSAGDIVRFNYGIPPACVKANLVQRGKQLIALTPGHNPTECNLRSLRKYVGEWFKHNGPSSATADNNQSK